MAKSAFKVDVRGVAEAIRDAGKARDALISALDTEVERATLRIASDAANDAPRLDGFLKNSITSSPKRKGKLAWIVGSDRPYAQRQEYEHKSKRGFFRKALFRERNVFRDNLRKIIDKVGGSV